jgi:hypothetical protein
VPQRYFLSATACRGILRRAEKRGKELPEALKLALQAVASPKPVPPSTPRCKDGFIRNQLGVGAVELPSVVGTLSDGAHFGGGLTGRTLTPEESSLATGGYFDEPTHSLRADGFDASEDGTGRGTPIIPIHDTATRHGGTDGSGHQTGKGHGLGIGGPNDPMFTITSGDKHAIAFRASGQEGFTPGEIAPPVTSTDGGGAGVPTVAQTVTADMYRSGGAVAGNNDQGVRNCFVQNMAVRRLTPLECERLQGFPDGWTDVPYRGKKASDGPRYKAIGNSWAVPVLNYIGRRILEVERVPATESFDGG